MSGYQIPAVDASRNPTRKRTVTNDDLGRAVYLCERRTERHGWDRNLNEIPRPKDQIAQEKSAIGDLLTRWNAVSTTDWLAADAIPQERRREFYAELQSLPFLDPVKLPSIEYPGPEDWEPSITFMREALRYTYDKDHGDKVEAVILKFAEPDKDEGPIEDIWGGNYPEVQVTFTCTNPQLVREIARAMGMLPSELAQKISADIGEPIPGCFRPLASEAPLVFGSLSQARAVTPKPAFVVDGLIPDCRVSLAHGPTGMGKTYWTMEIAAAVATDRPAFGHFPINRPGLVVFFAGEDPDDVIWARLPALEKQYGPLEGQLVVVDYALPLNDLAELERNLDALRRLAAEQPISLIVNDTYRKSVGPESINDGAVATAAYDVFCAIAREFGCGVLVTAHSPKGNDNELAGSQDLENLVPWSLLIKGKRQGKRLIAVDARQGEKCRVGEPIVPFSVDCLPVQLDDGGSNLILTGYREKTAKPEPDVAELAEGVAADLAAPAADNDRNAEILARHLRGESKAKIAREMHMRPATVLKVINETVG